MSDCNDNTPPWFTGRWQDWHRGHGCNKDDGKPRTEAGQRELDQQRGLVSDTRIAQRAPCPNCLLPIADPYDHVSTYGPSYTCKKV